MDYYEKYLKYKNKYLQLKEQIGSARRGKTIYKKINGKLLIEIYNSPYKKYITVIKPSTSIFKSNVSMDNTTLEDNLFTFPDESSYDISELTFKISKNNYDKYLVSQMSSSANTNFNNLFGFPIF
jgi:hypothetical protein